MDTSEMSEEVATALRDAWEREQALSGVLAAIRESRGEPAPVFAAIMKSATRLCDAPFVCILLKNAAGTHLELVAHSGARTGLVETLLDRGQSIKDPFSHAARVVRENLTSPVQIEDLTSDEFFQHLTPQRAAAVGAEGMRTLLIVPLVTEGMVTGEFFLYRREVRPFTGAQVALVEAFASQAAIALDNVNKYRELQMRLEREAASREILGVISQSRDDEKPVFDVILESATRLCNAQLAFVSMANDERTHLDLKAHKGDSFARFVDMLSSTPMPLDANEAETARSVLECRTIQIKDLRSGELYLRGQPHRVSAVEQGGIRTLLIVPLVSGGVGLGALNLWRLEVSPFSDDEVALVEAFAAQAVIAIENVRQFRALVEARDDAEAALADLKKAQERLIQAEKMASLGQLTAGIAHEIKNPLNFVNNFAKLSGEMVAELAEILEGPLAALGEEEREEAEHLLQTVRENLGKIDEHGRRADAIVKNMLLHSREGPSKRQTAKVNSIAAEALNLAYHGARAENSSFNIEIKTDLAQDVGAIECYPQDLMRVFLNIISNGMYAAYRRSLDEDDFAPEITVSSRLNGDRVEVAVRDNGRGIPSDVREKIFTPFFTTKPAGEGTGLGLSLSYDIAVKQHGGDLTVDSEPGLFTVFTVSLPRSLSPDDGGTS